MKITTISILFSLFASFSIWRTAKKMKNEMIGVRSGITWIVLWSSIGFFSLFPKLLDPAVILAQMKNRMLFILLIAFFVLFALVFDYASRIDNIQRNLRKLSREIAIINYKLEKKDMEKEQ